MADDFSGRGDSIGESGARRNEEQKLRDNQGGSELTNRPDDHPVGAPGETASAEAEGPPPSTISRLPVEPPARPDKGDIGAPVRSAGPSETTLPEASPLTGSSNPAEAGSHGEEGQVAGEGRGQREGDGPFRGDVARRHSADVPPGHIPMPYERGE